MMEFKHKRANSKQLNEPQDALVLNKPQDALVLIVSQDALVCKDYEVQYMLPKGKIMGLMVGFTYNMDKLLFTFK